MNDDQMYFHVDNIFPKALFFQQINFQIDHCIQLWQQEQYFLSGQSVVITFLSLKDNDLRKIVGSITI
jgi:hypothetical protein